MAGSKFHVFILILILCAIFLVSNLMHSEIYQCFTMPNTQNHQAQNIQEVTLTKGNPKLGVPKALPARIVDEDLNFNINRSSDVIVFLHIQKTGGTVFGKHLVNDLEYPCNCNISEMKRCDCFRPNSAGGIWLFSKFSTGWGCGVHADWTALKACVPHVMNRKEKAKRKRKFFYITQLRDPADRYISEWRHVQRGATWQARIECNGHIPTSAEVPLCYEGDDWIGVTLDEFLDCRWNMAINRQTRMLSDLSLVGCYDTTKMAAEDRNWLMLESAKRNLRRMAYFGLVEYQAESQYMFEQTFGMKFVVPLMQHNQTHASNSAVTPTQYNRIASINNLDIELYKYATNLFQERLTNMRANEQLRSIQTKGTLFS